MVLYFTNEVINSGFGPVIPSLNVMLKNSQNIYTSFEKFGSPIYSIYSLEKGSAVSYAASHKIENERNNITSLFKYAKFHTNYVYNHLPIEARGVNPPSGSNYFDKTILPDNGTDADYFAYPDEFVTTTQLAGIDPPTINSNRSRPTTSSSVRVSRLLPHFRRRYQSHHYGSPCSLPRRSDAVSLGRSVGMHRLVMFFPLCV